MKPILVTGAAGIVGRAIVKHLRDAGYRVTPLVRANGSIFLNALCIDLSMSDTNLSEMVPDSPLAVIHLAAAVPHSQRYPDNHASAALTQAIDRNVAEAVKRWTCPCLYMSSCGLYDRSYAGLKRENDEAVIKIISPYFEAKYRGEKRFSGMDNTTIFRLAAPIGPELKRGLVLSRFLRAADADTELQVWGSGNRQQNFVDVRDVARAVGNFLDRSTQGIINIAGSRPVTMLELAQAVVAVVGRGRIAINQQPDPGENETARYDIERAQQVLDWQPRISLTDSINWIYRQAVNAT